MRIHGKIIGTLVIVGGFVAFIASPFLYFWWHIALRSNDYRPATFVIDEVESKRVRRGYFPVAYGAIDGVPETLPLYDFGPTSDSTEFLRRAFPKGMLLDILYDQGAPRGFVLAGTSLRVLPRQYDIKGALSSAIYRTLLFYGPFCLGLFLVWRGRILDKREWAFALEQDALRVNAKRERRDALGLNKRVKIKRSRRI